MIFQVPTAGLYCAMYVVVFGVLSQAGLAAFDLWYRKQRKAKNNDTAGLIFGAISLIYSLILAFVIVAVWTDYEDLRVTIGKETYKLDEVLTQSRSLPDSVRFPIENALKEYCNTIITEEWTLNESDVSTFPGTIAAIKTFLMRGQHRDRLPDVTLTAIEADLGQICDLRRERLEHIRSHVPDVVWLILKAGSVILIVFSYFLDVPFMQMKRLYLFFLSSIVSMSLFLVDVLNDPFTGSVAVSKRPYEMTLQKIRQQLSFTEEK